MIRWVVASILFFIFLVICKLPAQFALYLADLPKGAQVAGVDGTIWSGQTQSISYQGQSIENVSWKVNSLALLTGVIELELDAGKSRSPIKLSGVAGVTGAGWYARGLEFEFPAALVGELYPLPAQISGNIQGSITEVSQGSPWCEILIGQVEWRHPVISSSMMGQPLPLDDTKASLSCEQGRLMAKITDKGQVLGLNVSASLGAKDYLLTGEMKPGAEFPSQFKQGLMFIASPISGGRYKVDMSGSLN